MTSPVSLLKLNYFNSYMILTNFRNILFGFTLACSDVRCQRIELEISYLVNIEIFISLLNCLYIIKRKFKCFC